MRSIHDADHLSPDDRLDELSRILAVGILRWSAQTGDSPDGASDTTIIPPNVRPPGLELSGPSRLTVTPR